MQNPGPIGMFAATASAAPRYVAGCSQSLAETKLPERGRRFHKPLCWSVALKPGGSARLVSAGPADATPAARPARTAASIQASPR